MTGGHVRPARRRLRRAGMAGAAAAAALAVAASAAAVVDSTGAAPEAATAAAAAGANSPGGSNYNFYRLDGCNREPYGVLKNFHTKRDLITDQLTEMHANGQRRLILGIFHRNGPETGTVMDSSGGDIKEQYKQNLADLLATADDIGFAEVEVAMHVLGGNSPNGWDSWHEDLYQENWQLIQKIRPIVRNSGIHYRLNLGNELTPAPNQPQTLAYTQRLWDDYTAAYGKGDTVGFSIIGSRPERIAAIPDMYGGDPPHLFDFHFYGDDSADEYEQFTAAHRQMAEMGYDQGWVVGETYYNDAAAADRIDRAIADTGREVYWLTQWPLTRDRGCDHVDVAPPAEFDAFAGAGF
ncbi:hypothetical protein [Streptomonospora wellingtoniae]|uniref:Glycoside hydrolase family 5 domain-containing protein n=1 Tax=Streptomonospora wellingtoniae TaxID=3075544 RepID=A0ABU2KNJ0_9ACTN|nr:hypothetical protein [Streptomonospora sp. DSM 45055]MDT0300748.1 hypothetical protein [Streptomonospora sp. DSM 45055]